jgi:3-oxoacid CoA-transferase subunit A
MNTINLGANPKIFKDAKSALYDLKSGMTIMSGGFGLCGIAENCIDALTEIDIKDLTIISNNIGNSGRGLVKILIQNKIKKAYCSYVGGNPDLEQRLMNQEIEVELVPQGTFSERIRAAGLGIRAFYTPTGYGTLVSRDKEVKIFDRPCILENALHADVAIIKAEIGDEYGNLIFKETARNFSPLMAMAAKLTIVEVEKLVPVGKLSPSDIHLPGIFVNRIFEGKNYKNDIEFLKTED